jgi:hypothetical protein
MQLQGEADDRRGSGTGTRFGTGTSVLMSDEPLPHADGLFFM